VNISWPLDPIKGGKFFSSWATVSFWGRNLLRAVSSIPKQATVQQCFETSSVYEDIALFCMPYWEILIVDSSLKMEVVNISEMLIPTYHITAECHDPKNHDVNLYGGENLKSDILKFFSNRNYKSNWNASWCHVPLLHDNFSEAQYRV
jgi:hypothetical protein